MNLKSIVDNQSKQFIVGLVTFALLMLVLDLKPAIIAMIGVAFLNEMISAIQKRTWMFNSLDIVFTLREQEYILDNGFVTIGKNLAESMAHLFADYVDASDFDDETRSSAKAMRSIFNEWRANLYDDDF